MTKIEIIKKLNKEVGLFIEHEEENDLGKLYLTGMEFKSAKRVLREIKELKNDLEKSVRFYKKKIRKNEKGNYIEVPVESILKGKEFRYTGDLIFLVSKNCVITYCYFGRGGRVRIN